MACILLRSECERISIIIQDINRLTDETYSDDSDNEDDASSTSSKSFAPKSDCRSNSSDDEEAYKENRISPVARKSRASKGSIKCF